MLELLGVAFLPDERIGSYRVESELGPSGSGILLQARHLVLPRRAIIKVIHEAFAPMQVYVVETLREACILEVVAHPGVPIVYESGVLRDRRPWFAFEAIAGPTLEELLASGPMSVIEVAELVRDLVEILEHAHRRGVIHRGLRPDRVIVATDRRFPLCIPDWSEAKAHDATSHAPSPASEEARRYLAPELADPEAGAGHELIDDRADMFALGVIAYRALTGGLPFAPGHDAASSAPAHALRPGAPPELAAIIDSLLALDRSDRPSAAEVRVEIDWLFETLPELSSRATSRRRAPEGRREDASGPPQDIVLLNQPRLRRPRWTPNVHHVEVGPGDLMLPGVDRAK